MAGTYTYTTTELNSIMAFSQAALGEMGQVICAKYVYGDPRNEEVEDLYYELFLYYWCITVGWQQNDNGTTTGFTNMFELEDLNNFIDRMRKITGSYTNA